MKINESTELDLINSLESFVQDLKTAQMKKEEMVSKISGMTNALVDGEVIDSVSALDDTDYEVELTDVMDADVNDDLIDDEFAPEFPEFDSVVDEYELEMDDEIEDEIEEDGELEELGEEVMSTTDSSAMSSAEELEKGNYGLWKKNKLTKKPIKRSTLQRKKKKRNK